MSSRSARKRKARERQHEQLLVKRTTRDLTPLTNAQIMGRIIAEQIREQMQKPRVEIFYLDEIGEPLDR